MKFIFCLSTTLFTFFASINVCGDFDDALMELQTNPPNLRQVNHIEGLGRTKIMRHDENGVDFSNHTIGPVTGMWDFARYVKNQLNELSSVEPGRELIGRIRNRSITFDTVTEIIQSRNQTTGAKPAVGITSDGRRKWMLPQQNVDDPYEFGPGVESQLFLNIEDVKRIGVHRDWVDQTFSIQIPHVIRFAHEFNHIAQHLFGVAAPTWAIDQHTGLFLGVVNYVEEKEVVGHIPTPYPQEFQPNHNFSEEGLRAALGYSPRLFYIHPVELQHDNRFLVTAMSMEDRETLEADRLLDEDYDSN